jgi:hypothetical protein
MIQQESIQSITPIMILGTLGIVFVLVFIIADFLLVVDVPIPDIFISDHAGDQHGDAEVAAIRNCIDKNKPYQVWQHNIEKNVFYFLCKLPDGKWGIQIFCLHNGTCFEKSAFIPKDGSLAEVIKYLSRNASKFTGPIQ